MDSRRWLDDIQVRLLKQGLPRAYTRRVVEELNDHLEDLKEETMDNATQACSRLGSPTEIADAAVVAYRRRSFVGRHPLAALVVFAVSPVMLLVLSAASVVAAVAWIAAWLGWTGENGLQVQPLVRTALPYAMPAATIVLPSLLLIAVYGRLAQRLCIGRKWLLTSILVLAISAGMTFCQLSFSGTSGHGSLTYGLGLQTAMQLGQFALPLALGGWLLRRQRELERLQSA